MNDFINRKLQKMSEEELETLAYHEIPIKNLLNYANPFGCWLEVNSDIEKHEIEECLNKNLESLEETPLWSNLDKTKEEEFHRMKHIKKIAYFVKNEPKKPIMIDIGFPDMGAPWGTYHIIDDGNHRLCGEYFAGKTHIKGLILGDEQFAKDLGLWNPNIYQKELLRRYEEQHLNRYKEKFNEWLKDIQQKNIKKDNAEFKFEISRSEFIQWCEISESYLDRKENLTIEENIFKNLNYEQKKGNLLAPYIINLSEKDANLIFKNLNQKNKIKLK